MCERIAFKSLSVFYCLVFYILILCIINELTGYTIQYFDIMYILFFIIKIT